MKKMNHNKLTDPVLGYLFTALLIVSDRLLHAMVEQDPDMSLRKFVRYNTPKLLRSLVRKQK